jgi:hypothetical protein
VAELHFPLTSLLLLVVVEAVLDGQAEAEQVDSAHPQVHLVEVGRLNHR